MLKYVIFDLDETLYPTTNGLMQTIGRRMREYIIRQYGLPPDEAQALQKQYFNQYGTTFRGLYVERHIDPEGYLKFVHDVPLLEFLRPDPRLREMLERIAQEKVILTNADARHARRVLDILGVSDLFTRIFDVVYFDYQCKPARAVYERLLSALPARGDECALVDDAERNLLPAQQLGIHTILLGKPGQAEAHIETIYEAADAIARLAAATSEQ